MARANDSSNTISLRSIVSRVARHACRQIDF